MYVSKCKELTVFDDKTVTKCVIALNYGGKTAENMATVSFIKN